MEQENGPGTIADANKKAYRHRIGFMANSPNFPGEWDKVIEKVKIADELGFDSIWLGKSWGYELFTSMADLVHATKHIKIGAGIANVYSRTPGLLASTAATLDERSGGQIMLGLGDRVLMLLSTGMVFLFKNLSGVHVSMLKSFA